MDKRQYYVSFIIDKNDQNSEPLHFTCPFVGEADEEKLYMIKLFLRKLTLPIKLVVEKEIMVGEHSDIPAVLVNGKDEFLWDELVNFQKRHVMPGHVSSGNWSPHITLKSAHIEEGAVLNVINVMIKTINPKDVIYSSIDDDESDSI